MDDTRRTLAAALPVVSVDPADPLALAAIGRYVAELDLRFTDGFEPGAGTAAELEPYRPPTGTFLVASCDDVAVACGAVRTIGPGVGEIKRMWVDPTWRGSGLGGRMLSRLEAEAVALEHHTIRLDTNAGLIEAIAMYQRAGYRPIPAYNDNPHAEAWFEKDLVSPGRRTPA